MKKAHRADWYYVLQESYLARRCCWSNHDDDDKFSPYRRLLNNITENLYVKGNRHHSAYK